MDISNKTLGLLLVAAIVISIGSTVISLNKLDGFSTTGFATSQDGTVNLSISETTSISINDSSINFGTCTIPGGADVTLDSFNGSSEYNNSICTGASAWVSGTGDYLEVKNDGNVAVDIDVKSNVTAATLFGTDSTLKYKSTGNASSHTTSYTAILTTDSSFCTNLGTTDGDNLERLYTQIYLPNTASTGGQMKLTFTASKN